MARRKPAAEAQLQDERARAPTPDDGYNGPDQGTFLAWVREAVTANQMLADARQARAAMRKRAKAAVIPMADWTPADAAVSEKDAESMGFIAATTGKGSFGVPPESLHPELHPAWLKGLHRGTGANGSKITPPPEDGPATTSDDERGEQGLQPVSSALAGLIDAADEELVN